MRKANASPLIPNPVTKSLSGNTTDVLSLVAEKKASLVTFAFSAFGEPHVKSFTDKFLEEFDSEPSVQLVQLNIEENWIKAPVLRLMTPFIRRKVPKERRDRYLMYYASIAESRRAAGMTNSVLGWVNLVDSEGRVRWQAHGPAKPQELNAMIKLTRELAQLDDSTRAIGDATVPPTTAEKEPSSNSADKP
ncbi:ATPase assembly factor ATP10 [Phlyctochytrium arcticum]|nr:ATPase assembly factor ATP10 [Phlyctochytrium arcticum]